LRLFLYGVRASVNYGYTKATIIPDKNSKERLTFSLYYLEHYPNMDLILGNMSFSLYKIINCPEFLFIIRKP